LPIRIPAWGEWGFPKIWPRKGKKKKKKKKRDFFFSLGGKGAKSVPFPGWGGGGGEWIAISELGLLLKSGGGGEKGKGGLAGLSN